MELSQVLSWRLRLAGCPTGRLAGCPPLVWRRAAESRVFIVHCVSCCGGPAGLDGPSPQSVRCCRTAPVTPSPCPTQGFPKVPRYLNLGGLTQSRESGEGGQDQSEDPHRGRTAAPVPAGLGPAQRGCSRPRPQSPPPALCTGSRPSCSVA